MAFSKLRNHTETPVQGISERRGVFVTVPAETIEYRPLSATENLSTPQSPLATIQQLNQTRKERAKAGFVLMAGLVIAALSAVVHFYLPPVLIALTLIVAYIVQKQDRARRTFHLTYRLSVESEAKWNLLNQSFSELEQAKQLWKITIHERMFDWRRNAETHNATALATAWRLMKRNPVTLKRQLPGNVTSNIVPYCLDLGHEQIFFFPDRVYILENNLFRVVSYTHLTVEAVASRFIEEGTVPADSEIVGDFPRRLIYENEPNLQAKLPIVAYHLVTMVSAPSLTVLLHCSSVVRARNFVKLFQQFTGNDATKDAQTVSTANTSSAKERRGTSHTVPTNPEPPPVTCYTVLGLTAECTKEEAIARYRELAWQYHPDRLQHRSPEHESAANEKLKEINVAYTELKRLHGW